MAGPVRLPMADSHNDLLLGVLHQRERGHRDPFGEFWLPQLREGDVVLQVLPIYTEEQFVGEGALRRALRYIETAAGWPSSTARRRHREDRVRAPAALASGRIALVLAFEGLEPMGADLAVLDAFVRLGVRIASMTWNRRTHARGRRGRERHRGRLTRLGVGPRSSTWSAWA